MRTIGDALQAGYAGLILFSDDDKRGWEILPLSAASVGLDVLDWSHAMGSTVGGRPLGAALVRSISASATLDELDEFLLWGTSPDL